MCLYRVWQFLGLLAAYATTRAAAGSSSSATDAVVIAVDDVAGDIFRCFTQFVRLFIFHLF